VITKAIDVGSYPRSQIQVSTQELEVDGQNGHEMDALLLNTVCLALLDTGVRMRHVFAAVSIALNEKGEEFDRDKEELVVDGLRASLTFVFKPSTLKTGDLLASHATGRFSTEEYGEALERARSRCLAVFDFYREQMQHKFATQLMRHHH
jgi:ribonuclease PH